MEPTGKTSEEVEIPKLAENGQNWKIYRAKIIEATATDITKPLGVLAGWQLDNGSYDWECLDAILKWTFYTTVPISILRPIWKLNTAHEIFNYLAKRFHNPTPIVDPHATSANEAKRGTDENSNVQPKESPISENAATERHANAKLDEEDLSTTKDLSTRGMEDPHVSREASAEGNSAESADGTWVLLEGVPHEMQTELHSSLPLTPSRCKQEAADSVVTAERTNGTAEMAKPMEIMDINSEKAALGGKPAERACRVDEGDETNADVDRTATLGEDPAMMACRVDEGDRTERRDLQLQQTNLLCEETRQRNGNAEDDIPSAHRLPLEGEWIGCASGESNDSKGDADALNAAVEHAYGPGESRETEDTASVESEGCREGMSERASVDETDGDPGQGVEPMDVPNELDTLVIVSIESEDLRSSGILHVYLGGPGRGTDVSKGLPDGTGAQTDASNASNKPEMAIVSHSEGAGTYLGARDAKRVIEVMDGVGSHADTSSGRGDVQSVRTDAVIPAKATDNIRTTRKKEKPPDLPSRSAERYPDEPDCCGNHPNTSSVHTDAHRVGNERQMAENNAKNVRTRQTVEKMQDSPYTAEIVMPEPISRWRRVSASDIDVYIPLNTPIAVPMRQIVFG